METFSALPGREWELALDPRRALRAGREWIRRRVDAPPPGREWSRSSTSLDERPPLVPAAPERAATSSTPPSGMKRAGAVAAIAALGALAFAVERPMASSTVIEPSLVEATVDAADLEPGSLYHLVDQIGARQMWDAGFTGAGVNVAVVDTGVSPVDSLAGDGKITAVVDLSAESVDPSLRYVDSVGHGTHMAGIIAGSETDLPAAAAVDAPQEFKGVAPDAGIVSVKVAGGDGATDPNDVIAGVNWVVDNAEQLDIRVLNLSYDSGSDLPYQEDALTAALERAWQAGIVVVTPAGNDGAEAGGLDSPANDPHFIAVGGVRALDDGFEIAEWSSRGDGVRNPDVTAPGAHIQSLRAPGSDADVNHPEGYVDHETYLGSGTSQSSAVVAGAAALLLDAHPEWTNDEVKSALASTAVPLAGVAESLQGNGTIRVDLAAEATDLARSNTWPTADASATAASQATPAQGFASLWTGASWTGASWTGASWTGASWTGASWTGASWTGASWTGASWTGASWTGASWTGASWTGASWTGASWTGASWTGASWTGASWTGASWTGASWTGASWTGASWTGASWTGASWTGASWTGASWTGASWTGASWTGASWTGASWTGASWTGASWTGASWTGASWTGASWTGASWTGASWT